MPLTQAQIAGLINATNGVTDALQQLQTTVQTLNANAAAASTQVVVGISSVADLVSQIVTLTADPITTQPGPVVTPTTGPQWLSGFFADHDKARAQQLFASVGRGSTLNRITQVFPTQSKAGLTNSWWQGAVPAGSRLSIRLPLCFQSGGSDLATAISDNDWRTIAGQIAAIDPHAYVAPGWEMNGGWPWALTSGNLSAWRAAYARCYAQLKSVCPTLQIGFNGNGGDTGRAVPLVQAWVDGMVDWCGPDQYNGWLGAPSGTTTAASMDRMVNQAGGLKWWADLAVARNVPFALPEWGPYTGTGWAGNNGGDSALYIDTISTVLSGLNKQGRLAFDSYFDCTEPSIHSSLSQNPVTKAEYLKLFTVSAAS